MVEYLRPVGILTSNSPPPTLSRPTSALGQSRDNSQDGHVTKIKIQDNEKEADSKSLRGNWLLTQIIFIYKDIVICTISQSSDKNPLDFCPIFCLKITLLLYKCIDFSSWNYSALLVQRTKMIFYFIFRSHNITNFFFFFRSRTIGFEVAEEKG